MTFLHPFRKTSSVSGYGPEYLLGYLKKRLQWYEDNEFTLIRTYGKTCKRCGAYESQQSVSVWTLLDELKVLAGE